MGEQKWTPGKMKVVDVAGAGLQLHVTLPKGFRFDCTQFANGATEFMVFTVRDRGDVAIGDFRWVQFATAEWEVAEKANAERLAACWNAMDGIPDPSAYVSRVAAMEEALRGLVAWHENNTLHRAGCECGGTSDGGKTWCGQQVQLVNKAKSALEGGGCNGNQ